MVLEGLLQQTHDGLYTGRTNMEIEEKQDVEELERSLEIAQKFFEINTPQFVGDQIGELLVLKTLELVKAKAADASHYFFTANELFEPIRGENNPVKARRWMKEHDDNLSALFAQTSESPLIS